MRRFMTARLLLVGMTVLVHERALAEPIALPDGQTMAKVDFERHVHAVLDRAGCSAGKCHGNRDGKGGLSLSLMSGSPAQDHEQITRTSRGRYLNLAAPQQSLLLLKATGQTGHVGGRRLLPDSWEERVISRWIAEGAAHKPEHGEIRAMHVIPQEHVFQPGESRQLKVVVRFADNSTEDVTCFCDYRLPEGAPVRVSRTGKIEADKPGDVPIRVFYRGRTRVMRAMVAMPMTKGTVYPKIPEVNFIDRAVFARLRTLNIVPSDLCSDEQFLRRITIDLIGTLPTPAEVLAFKASKDADKRTKKIDELLAHPLHSAMLATRFCEALDMVGADHEPAATPQTKAAQMAHDWFRKRLRENMPYDRIVAGVLTATSAEARPLHAWHAEQTALAGSETGFGSAYAERATLDHFWRKCGTVRPGDPVFGHFGKTVRPKLTVDAEYFETVAERTAVAFLGINLECARCHLHPLDGWAPADYRAFANVFAKVRLEKVPYQRKKNEDWYKAWERDAFVREVFLGEPNQRWTHPDTGAILQPRLLGGPEIDFREGDARQTLARWLARSDNPFFARHFVNSLWESYFGVNLSDVGEPFTSRFFEQSGGSRSPALLDLLAEDFIQHSFDIRRLERTILLSRTYQLSSQPSENNKNDRTNFSHAIPRRFRGRVTADILNAVFETCDDHGPKVPPGLHAIEVMHAGKTLATVGSGGGYAEHIERIVGRFGRKELIARCDNEVDLRSYIHYLSSDHMTDLIKRSKRIDRLASQPKGEIIDECFLATLSRLPTSKERATVINFLEHEKRNTARTGVEDLLWLLVNMTEFLTRR